MPINFTGSRIRDTFAQLLHLDGGPAATEKVVYSAAGVATAMKIGTGSASVDNIRLDGNTISTLDTDGNLVLAPNGTGSVSIAKIAFTDVPQARTALGLGSMALQAADSVAITGGTISGVTFSGSFNGMTLVEAQSMRATEDLGYSTGAGGTVTQTTSKSTGVTLDKASGQITMHNATLNRNTGVSFVLTNSVIAATDVVIVNIASGATPGVYTASVDAVAAGSCTIQLHNHSTGVDLSEAVVLNFVVIKGVHA